MAARIVENLFLCSKRWDLEATLDADSRWKKRAISRRFPMSGSELVCRILCWLDTRGDPHGRMYGVPVADIERAAQWTGAPGALVSALISTRWIDTDPEGMRWHGYGSLNRITLTDRRKKRNKRGDGTGDTTGDKTRDETGDSSSKAGDRTGASVSESGRSSEGSPRTQSARASLGAPLGAPAAAREADPEAPIERYPPVLAGPMVLPPRRFPSPPPKPA